MRSPADPAPASVVGGVSSWLLGQWLVVDLVWAGVFRIGLGLCLLWDLARRASELERLHSNAGVLPNHYALFDPPEPGLVSLLHPFSSPAEVAVAFAAIAMAYLALTFGVATRGAQVASAAGVVSLAARTPLVADPASAALTLLALWTIVLPLGRRLSLDALRASLRAVREKTGADLRARPVRSVAPTRLASLAVFGLSLHWAALYAATGSTLARGDAALDLPARWVNAVAAIGIVVALLLITPVLRVWRIRLAAILALAISVLVARSTAVGPLPVVLLLPFVLLLAEADRRALAAGLRGRVRVVIYDADCGVCLLVARVLARLDGLQRLRLVGNDEIEEIPAAVDQSVLDRTIVVVDGDRVHTEGRAVAAIVAALPGGALAAGLLRAPGIRQLVDRAYRAVAARRLQLSAWLGLGACGLGGARSELQLTPPPRSPWLNIAVDAGGRRRALARATWIGREVVALALAATLLAGARSTLQRREAPGAFGALARALQPVALSDVFGGAPPVRGRLVVDARTATGERIDPLSGAPPTLAPEVAAPYGALFARYAAEIRRPERARYRQFLVAHALSLHEQPGGPAVDALDVWWVWPADDGRPPENLVSHRVGQVPAGGGR